MDQEKNDIIRLDFNNKKDCVIFNKLFTRIKREKIRNLIPILDVKNTEKENGLEIQPGTELASDKP